MKNIIHFNHNPQKNSLSLICNICWPNFPLETVQPNYVLILKVLDTNKYLISWSLNIVESHLEIYIV